MNVNNSPNYFRLDPLLNNRSNQAKQVNKRTPKAETIGDSFYKDTRDSTHNNSQIDNNSQIEKKIHNKIELQPEIRLPLVEYLKHKIKYNGYPIETAAYKAVEKIVKSDFMWRFD